jgi:hypothetical protein
VNCCESALICYLKGLLFAGMKFARVLLNLPTLVSEGEATKMFHFNRQTKRMRSAIHSGCPVQHVNSWQPWLSRAAIREAGAIFENHNAAICRLASTSA